MLRTIFMIQVNNLVKIFQTGDTELTALKRLSFAIPEGQFLAITGRSGSGKSTLLYQLSLLDTPSSGTVKIGSDTITDFDNEQRIVYRRNNFGFIFQDYALLPSLTAKENVMLPLLMQGIPMAAAEKDTVHALASVGLADRINNLPTQLSGGQQQRVSIARAIVHKPKVLFADEPTANLDTESSHVILDNFLQLNKTGLTIVMVTHEPDYAKMGDRLLELRDGTIIKDQLVNKKKKP